MFGEFQFATSLFGASSAVKRWKEICKKATLWSTIDRSVILTKKCV